MSADTAPSDKETSKAKFGIAGLDDVLGGGLTRDRLYLLEGNPGTGKTTIAPAVPAGGRPAGRARPVHQPVGDDRRAGETARLARLELARRRSSHLRADPAREPARRRAAAEPAVLLRPRTRRDDEGDLRAGRRGQARPRRARQPVGDPPARGSSLRYRRQILALKHYFARQAATVLLLDDLTSDALDKTVHSVAHAVIRLEELAPDYGAERRRVRVIKYRGQRFRGGYHDFNIATGGVEVFPRLIAAGAQDRVRPRYAASGIPELDALLGGGIGTGIEHPAPRARPAPASPCSRSSTSSPRSRAARRRRCSCSTRNSGCCWSARKAMGFDLAGLQ